MELRESNQIQWIIRYPKGFSETQTYPLLLFLHGAGTRGDINKLKDGPLFARLQEFPDVPFVTVAPFSSGDTWFDSWERLKALVNELTALPFVDRDRVYLMGASMGGYATWQLGMSMPEVFAAMVPICGGGMYWNAARLRDIPIWAFHGAKDKTVLLEESQKMVNAVNAKGGSAKLTVYPDNAHDAWSDTYSNWEVFAWLLAQKKGDATGEGDASFLDAKKYG